MTPEAKSFSRRGAAVAAFLAQLLFGVTIILIPFRFRYVLLERPVSLIYKDFTNFLLFGSDIAVLVLITVWLLSLPLYPRPVGLGPKILWLPMIGLFLTSLMTSFTSLDAALSLYHTLRLIILFLFYLYIVNEIRSLSFFMISISIQVIIQSLVALAQFFLQYSIGLNSFGEHELDPAVGGVSIVSTGSTRVLRAYGLTEHPNILGGCLALSLLLLFAVYLYGKEPTRKGVTPVFLLGLVALFVTFSRSAWLAFLGGISLLAGIAAVSRDWQKVKSVLWFSLPSILLLIPLVWNYSDYIGARLNVGDSYEKNPYENRSIGQRLILNEVGVHIFLDRPLTGIGLGASALAIKRYYSAIFVPPHLVLLVVAMETGIFGLFFYWLLLLLPLVVVVRKKKMLIANPLLLTATVLLIAITLIGFFDIYPWLLQPGRLWQWLSWGLWAVAYELDS